jgi:NAD+ synthase (glutamine-hydrolysing)
VAFGYATLYGDAIGALAPIGDLVKTRLFDLARSINGQPGCEVIPENLLPRETTDGYEWSLMPSAELSEGQRDPMKWFYHDWLVEQLLDSPTIDDGACHVLELYLEDRLLSSEVGKWISFYGLEDPRVFLEDFNWCMSSMRKNAFKRVQAPPAITLASKASVERVEERQGEIEPSSRMEELRARIARL